jgi:hypothetical protein
MSTCLVLAVLKLFVHGGRRHCPMLLDASLALSHPTTLTFEGVIETLHLLRAANVLGNCFSLCGNTEPKQMLPRSPDHGLDPTAD